MGNLMTKKHNSVQINENYVQGINTKIYLNRAKLLLIYGHSYEATREYKDALSCYEEAIDILHFLSECGMRKQKLVDMLTKEMVSVIRKSIIVRKVIAKNQHYSEQNALEDNVAVVTTRPDPEEALEILIEDLPEEEQEYLLRIKNCVKMQVPTVKWDDIIGLQAAKTALIEAIVDPTVFIQVIT